MNNIYLLIGDELKLKDLRIENILNQEDDYELETIYADSYKPESYSTIADKINIFLSTFDFFGNSKVLKLVLLKPAQLNPILSKIDSFDGDNKLIIDLRCPDYLAKNIKAEYQGNQIKLETFFKFKDYEKDKVAGYIKDKLKDYSIEFSSDYDLELAIDYLFKNSLNSYSLIYSQIEKLKLLNKKILTYDDITFVMGGLSDKNSYKICDSIFKSNSTKDAIEYLEDTISISDYKMFSTLVNTFLIKLQDYILVNNKKMCKVKANYYTFKNSKLKIINANELLLKLNNLAIQSKTKKCVLKEEFLLLLLEHLEF